MKPISDMPESLRDAATLRLSKSFGDEFDTYLRHTEHCVCALIEEIRALGTRGCQTAPVAETATAGLSFGEAMRAVFRDDSPIVERPGVSVRNLRGMICTNCPGIHPYAPSKSDVLATDWEIVD